MHESRTTPHACEWISRSAEETQRLGERLGALLRAGDVVGLIGELGSGKTTFVQGLAKGMGLDQSVVKSPTFVLMREYRGRIPLIHVDGYRLEHPDQALWLDVDWLFSPKRVTVIEWAERLASTLPSDYLELRFAHKTTNHRSISVVAHGPHAHELLKALETTHEPAGD
jgi:tRNA threonylcarbamoyladenosine biosynthesis protein TsaE